MKTSTLKLEWKTRPGGGGQTERRFLDFVIDGVSLHEAIRTTYITPLGWLDPEYEMLVVDRLLRKEPSDLADDRRSLFVCAECADLGCGCISVRVERVGDQIIWKDFGFQNSYEPEVAYEDFREVGPFAFNATQYFDEITSSLRPRRSTR